MLAIVAAVMALAPAPAVRPAQADAPPLLVAARATPLRDRRLCSAGARLQTGYEPALLFHEQDRRSARLRKLIELPMADACLMESPR